jgi:ubiquitin-protein ligase
MQVRDMKVGLMDSDFALHPNFGGTMQTHSPYNAQNLSSQTNPPNGYPFAPPNAPSHKEGNLIV